MEKKRANKKPDDRNFWSLTQGKMILTGIVFFVVIFSMLYLMNPFQLSVWAIALNSLIWLIILILSYIASLTIAWLFHKVTGK